jgi:hypothetical protein|tara:strand:+ start:38 stop:775 length:738 start_codon:yes stop_codon:yes gene_type:complete
MATTTVYYSSQGRVDKTTGGTPSASWATVRGSNTTTGNSVASTGANENFACKMEAARGGSVFTSNKRAYFYFDLSSIGTTISSITLKARGGTNAANQNGDWIVARANSDNDFGTIATSDYPLVFNSTTSFTSYSAFQATNWSANTNNSVALNAAAITNANSGGELCVCLMNYTYDFANTAVEESFGNIENTLSFANSGTSRANLVVVHADAATGYPNPVNAIASANINKINAILSTDINKVNGVS